MNDKQRSGGRVRKQKLHKVKLLYVQRGRQVRNIQTLPILAIEVDCKRKKSDPRRCARHNGRVRENPGRQQPCWGSLFCTNLTQPTGSSTSETKNTLDMPITVYPAYFFHFLLRSRPVPCIPEYIPPLRLL